MKRVIPKTHCIRVMMWNNPEQKSLLEWEDFKTDMSAMETGAGSLTAAMKIVKDGLKRGHYTHFILSYPVAMQGGPTRNNPHAMTSHPDYIKGIK